MLAPNTALLEGTRKLLKPRPRSLATLKYSLGTYLLETFPYNFFLKIRLMLREWPPVKRVITIFYLVPMMLAFFRLS